MIYQDSLHRWLALLVVSLPNRNIVNRHRQFYVLDYCRFTHRREGFIDFVSACWRLKVVCFALYIWHQAFQRDSFFFDHITAFWQGYFDIAERPIGKFKGATSILRFGAYLSNCMSIHSYTPQLCKANTDISKSFFIALVYVALALMITGKVVLQGVNSLM